MNKKINLLLCICILAYSGIAQNTKNESIKIESKLTINADNTDFAPIGTVWHYSYQTINPGITSFQKISSVSDTTINGIVCKKLIESIKNEAFFMYSKNDSVFVYKDNAFQLLYDFGAQTGETITLGSYYKTNNGQPLTMIIDSVKTITLGGSQRKVQYVSCGDGAIISFGGAVIEGIGNIYHLFPTIDFSYVGPLRCYQEPNSSLIINPFYPYDNWNKTDCEQIIIVNNLDTNNLKNNIPFYPNPANNELFIYNNETTNSTINIYDITGKLVLTSLINKAKNKVDVSKLSNGFYVIELINPEAIVKSNQLIIKH